MSGNKLKWCDNSTCVKRALGSNPKLETWKLRNNSTQMGAVLTPQYYKETSDSDEFPDDIPELKVKWRSPKQVPSRYHQNCQPKKPKLYKLPKSKLKRVIVSQPFPNDPGKIPGKFINKCYCTGPRKKPLLPLKPDYNRPGANRYQNAVSGSNLEEGSSHSLDTLKQANELLTYSPKTEFLKRLRREAKEVYDCNCSKCRIKEENTKLKYTSRRQHLENAYRNYDNENYGLNNVCRDIHRCGTTKQLPEERKFQYDPNCHDPINCQCKCTNKYQNLQKTEILDSPRMSSKHQKSNVRSTYEEYDVCDLCHDSKNCTHRQRLTYPLKTDLPIAGMKSPRCRSPQNSTKRTLKYRIVPDLVYSTDSTHSMALRETEKCPELAQRKNREYDQDKPPVPSSSNSRADLDNIENCDKMSEVRNIRRENYFETRNTDDLDSRVIPEHKCVHKFTLDERLLPKPLNADPFGVSRCTICNKPMENDIKLYNSNTNRESEQTYQQLTGSKETTTKLETNPGYLLKYSYTTPRRINIGSKNDIIELKIPPGLLEASKVLKFKKPIAPQNSWALRYQKGVI